MSIAHLIQRHGSGMRYTEATLEGEINISQEKQSTLPKTHLREQVEENSEVYLLLESQRRLSQPGVGKTKTGHWKPWTDRVPI